MRNSKADCKATTCNKGFYLYRHKKERAVETRAAKERKDGGKEASLNMFLTAALPGSSPGSVQGFPREDHIGD